MKRWPQFSLGYLLAMMFWWSLVFLMIRECVPPERGMLQAVKTSYYVLFFPIAAGAAVGGIVLQMRAGFVVGLIITAVLWILVVCIEQAKM